MSCVAFKERDIEVVYQALQQTSTRTGLRVVCEMARKEYRAGIMARPHFLANEPIQRDPIISAYNYTFSPN